MMQQHADRTSTSSAAGGRFGTWPSRLLVELAIGIGVAAVLLLVAWASSNTIHFVYGGY